MTEQLERIEQEVITMNRRKFLTQTAAASGSIAGLLSLTGKTQAAAIEDLQAALPSQAVAQGKDFIMLDPGTPSFKSLVQGFNGRWSAPNAQRIYLPLTEVGVASAVTKVIADGHGRAMKVRGGAHCYEDFVFNSGVEAIVDMSLLNTVGFDAERQVYFAQGGANNFDLQYGLIRFGKTLPGGSCPTVGLGGHLCGGGYGLLSRLYGLTVDWLTGVSLVQLREGVPKMIRVDQGSSGNEGDLFWAHTGGGGGNFGFITRYEFGNLPAAPVSAEVQIYAWDWTVIRRKGVSFLTRIIRFFEDLCESMGPTAFVILKLTHADSGQVQILIQDVALEGASAPARGKSGIADRLTSRLESHGLAGTSPVLKTLAGHPAPFNPKSTQVLTWWEAISFFATGAGPMNGKYKSAYMRKTFSDDAIRKIYRHLTIKVKGPDGRNVSLANSLLQVDSYGGKINEVGKSATAVWQRDSIFKLQFQTYWPIERGGASQDVLGSGNLKWIRDFYSDLYSESGGIPDPASDSTGNVDGCYINYPDVDLNAYGRMKALQLYYGNNLSRLMRAKSVWDPTNFLSNAQSIPAG